MDRGAHFWRLATIVALAFALRMGAGLAVQNRLPPKALDLIAGDAEGYWILKEQIVQGKPFEVWNPPRQVHRMPGFPAVLALAEWLFGPAPIWTRMLLAGVGALGCAAVSVLGTSLFDERTGFIAACITAVVPTFVGFSPLFLSETAFAVTLVLSLCPAVPLLRGLRSGSTSTLTLVLWAALCGALISVACYIRPSWLLWAPFVGLFCLIAGRARPVSWGVVMVIGAATFLTLLPWGLRNQRVTGHFILTTLWSGPSLYDGLHEGATGESEMSFFDRDNLMSKMSEYDVNREYSRRAIEFAKNNPGRAVELGFEKLRRFWMPWPSADQFSSWIYWLAVVCSSIPLFALAIYGWQTMKPDWITLALTLGPVLYFSAIHMVFVGSIRYRLPAEYPITVLAALGILALRKPSVAQN